MNCRDKHCCKTGTYECNVPVLMPTEHGYELKSVDKCLISELYDLWLAGIETIGCCCGHFETDPYIQVYPSHVNAMHKLGYEQLPEYEIRGEVCGNWCFKPHTKFTQYPYVNPKSELEERYEQLQEVAKSLCSSTTKLQEIEHKFTELEAIINNK